MAKAPESAVAAEEIVFELDRFDLREGERLELSGRWFGVRGRRFVRPTLTLEDEGERFRALADLEHKPWPAEDGAPWMAAFPLRDGLHVHESELSVAPDITVRLPAPTGKRSRSRRLIADPRRHSMNVSWPDLAEVHETGESGNGPDVGSREDELDELRAEVERLRDALETVSGELEAVQSLLDQRDAALKEHEDALEAVGSELAGVTAERDAATAAAAEREATANELANALAERDTAAANAQEAIATRDAAIEDATRTSSELTHARDELTRLQAELDRLNREREAAVTSRGAALVMRGATRADPAWGPHSWMGPALALLVVIGVVCAVLLVLRVL